jgi:hypothetical protein
MLLERRVQVVHVRGVVLPVVNLHGLRVDVRLERAEIVRQVRQLMGHRALSFPSEVGRSNRRS